MGRGQSRCGWVLSGADDNLDANVLGGANKNVDTEHNAGETDGADNNTDADLDIDRSDKNVDTEHNIEKEVKVCKSNLI